VYVKGAPEKIVPMCTETLNQQVNPIKFGTDTQQTVIEQVVSMDMATSGLKPLTYAFK
jgi:magnesium-transporting ATPase (P-type)